MDEPAIISWGRTNIDKYSAEEFRQCLVRAFKDGGADFITLDDNMHGQKFVAAAAAWAIDEGIIYNDANQFDEQSAVSSFRLTEKGKKQILGRK